MYQYRINDRLYFATSAREDEIEILKKARPPRLLVSFALWRTVTEDKCLKRDLIDQIGYQPESIIIDSGAYSFGEDVENGLAEMIDVYREMIEEDGKKFCMKEFSWWAFGEFQEDFYTEDKNQFYLFEQYLNFLWYNQKYFDYCFAFDVMGENESGLLSFQVMNALGINVIPVFQATIRIGAEVLQEKDYSVLDYFAKHTDYIAIGGTAFSKIKGYTKLNRIRIVRDILERYPNHRFHLLGTLDSYIMDACCELHSVDGQSWLEKVNDREKKIQKSVEKIQQKLLYAERKANEVNLFSFVS